jgi:hypothetical protein
MTLVIQPALADLPVVRPERHPSVHTRLRLVRLEEHLQHHVAGRDRLGRDLPAGLHAEELKRVVEQAVLVDPQREAADEVGERDDDALCASVGNTDLGLDRVRAADDPRGPSAPRASRGSRRRGRAPG